MGRTNLCFVRVALIQLFLGNHKSPEKIPRDFRLIRIAAVLGGEDTGGALSVTLLNAAAGLYVAGAVSSLKEGVDMAREVIASGAARRSLEALAQAASSEPAPES